MHCNCLILTFTHVFKHSKYLNTWFSLPWTKHARKRFSLGRQKKRFFLVNLSQVLMEHKTKKKTFVLFSFFRSISLGVFLKTRKNNFFLRFTTIIICVLLLHEYACIQSDYNSSTFSYKFARLFRWRAKCRVNILWLRISWGSFLGCRWSNFFTRKNLQIHTHLHPKFHFHENVTQSCFFPFIFKTCTVDSIFFGVLHCYSAFLDSYLTFWVTACFLLLQFFLKKISLVFCTNFLTQNRKILVFWKHFFSFL